MPLAENVGFEMPGKTNPAVLLSFQPAAGRRGDFCRTGHRGAAGRGQRRFSPSVRPGCANCSAPMSHWLVLAVAGGVGLAVSVGMLRTMFGWQLKTMILLIVPPDSAADRMVRPAARTGADHRSRLGLWRHHHRPGDRAAGAGGRGRRGGIDGRSDNPLSGFGIVTLASIFPVLTVLCTAIYLTSRGRFGGDTAGSATGSLVAGSKETPFAEIIGALRAIVPLVLLLVLVQTRCWARRFVSATSSSTASRWPWPGMLLFNLGLTEGLVALGEQAGNNVPWAFSENRETGAPPLYPFALGIGLTLAFAFAIGFGATVAEPALNAMGMTVENLTDGAFRKRMLIHAVAAGVGVGSRAGGCPHPLPPAGVDAAARRLFDRPGIDRRFARRDRQPRLGQRRRHHRSGDRAACCWRSASASAKWSGPPKAFGILAMCSVGPIISVLGTGLWIDMKTRGRKRRSKKA
jgi:hypothetical protein